MTAILCPWFESRSRASPEAPKSAVCRWAQVGSSQLNSRMPLKQLPSDLPIHTFSSAQEFEAFLDDEHTTAAGCYIKLAKKASGIPSITAPEAVEICLCFGWIDGGGGGSIDETWWLKRYTPRRPKSIWSKKNRETVARLSQEGKMGP